MKMALLYSGRLLTPRMVLLCADKNCHMAELLSWSNIQLRQIGLDPTKYGLYSLRSGGASLAAAISVPDCQIIRHGGWQSESSVNRYVKEVKNSLLAMSKAFQFQVSHLILFSFLGFSRTKR